MKKAGKRLSLVHTLHTSDVPHSRLDVDKSMQLLSLRKHVRHKPDSLSRRLQRWFSGRRTDGACLHRGVTNNLTIIAGYCGTKRENKDAVIMSMTHRNGFSLVESGTQVYVGNALAASQTALLESLGISKLYVLIIAITPVRFYFEKSRTTVALKQSVYYVLLERSHAQLINIQDAVLSVGGGSKAPSISSRLYCHVSIPDSRDAWEDSGRLERTQ